MYVNLARRVTRRGRQQPATAPPSDSSERCARYVRPGGPRCAVRRFGRRAASRQAPARRRVLEPLAAARARAARQRLGRVPDPVERLDAGLRDHRVAEHLALLVLAHLHVQPEQALDQPLGRRAAAAARVHRRPQLLVAGDRLGRDRVHDVLGVALDHRHRRLHARHQRALLLRLHQRGQPAVAEGLDQLRRVGHRRQPAGGAAVDAHLHRRQVAGAPCRRGGRAASRRPGTGTRGSARARRSSGGTSPARPPARARPCAGWARRTAGAAARRRRAATPRTARAPAAPRSRSPGRPPRPASRRRRP